MAQKAVKNNSILAYRGVDVQAHCCTLRQLSKLCCRHENAVAYAACSFDYAVIYAKAFNRALQ